MGTAFESAICNWVSLAQVPVVDVDIALDLLTTCTTGTCASDTQLQMALSNAVAISRSQDASGARDTAVEQFTADSGQLAISEPSDSRSGGNY